MRRLRATLAFAALCLSLFPARADAYIWAWLDDLSGPWFGGTVVEWRVYCRSESIVPTIEALQRLRNDYAERRKEYETAAEKPRRAQVFYRNASGYLGAAITFLDFALASLDRDPNVDVSRLRQEAVIWRMYAKLHADWAARLAVDGTLDPGGAPGTPTLPDVTAEALAFFVFPSVGVSFSLCEAKPNRRNTQFLSLNAGYAWDAKKSNREFRHRMVTVGASYHLIVSPSVTLGAGAGLATFTSKTGDAFRKAYVQPMIVDVRPFLFWKKNQESSPWYHVLYVRGSVVTFPAGFEAGRFGRQPERFEAELTPTVGIHFDFSPVIQNMQGKWRRKEPLTKVP